MNTRQRRLLRRLADVREGTTICAGRLARDSGSNLKTARPDLVALADSGKIVLRRGGKRVAPEKLKGPFRVSLK